MKLTMNAKIQILLNKCSNVHSKINEQVNKLNHKISQSDKPLRKYLIIGLGVLILVLIFLFFVLIIPKEKNVVTLEKKVFLQENLYAPVEPSFSDEYVLHREPVQQWSVEEVENWFTVPNEDMIENLKETNSKIISNLLEMAP